MIKRPMLGIKLNDEWFTIGDIVEVEFSDYVVKNNFMEMPYAQQEEFGRIIDVKEDYIRLDCSELYESNIINVGISSIFKISKRT